MRAHACLQAALPGFAGVAALKRVAQDPSVVRNKRALALHSLGQCAPTDDMVSPLYRSAPAEDFQESLWKAAQTERHQPVFELSGSPVPVPS